MQFSGCCNSDHCPITHVPVKDLRHPVGFDTSTAYECDALVEWLTKGRSSNPLSNELMHGRIIQILTPLIVTGTEHIAETYDKLNQAGITKVIMMILVGPPDDTSHLQATKAEMMRVCSDHAFRMAIQSMFFILVTYVVALNLKISEIIASSSGVVITMASFGRLIYDTCKAYPDNGPWIVLNFCVVRKSCVII